MSQDRLFQMYEEELAYLFSAGEYFARLHPERAGLVGLSNVSGRDPDVERLVEAFAFLAAQVRAELASELPELTHTLLTLLWPHYLRMVPATTTVQFQPDIDQLSRRDTIPARIGQVESVPILTRETRREITCLFHNSYDVDLYPIRMRQVELERTYRASLLRLDLEVGPNAEPNLDFRPLRIHFGGDAAAALELRRWLLEKTVPDGLRASFTDPEGRPQVARIGPIRSVGLGPEHALLEHPRRSFPGHRLMQEYFATKSKFLYIDLLGMEKVAPVAPGSTISISIPLVESPPEGLRFTTDTFLLFCSPVVNIFRHSAIPIRYDGKRNEYPILPDHDSQAYAIYCLRNVYGHEGGAQIVEYPGFLDFRSKLDSGEPYYHARMRTGVEGKPEWFLSLVSPSQILKEQVVSVEMDCTNGELPASLLAGDIRYRSVGIPDSVQVRNLAACEGMQYPPADSASEWRVLSALAANQMTLEDAGSLVGALKLHDWTQGHIHWRRLQAIKSLIGQQGCAFVDGVAVPGRDTTAELDLAGFTNEGDAVLFAEVLAHYLALSANVNSFVRLISRFSNGVVRRWPAMTGQQLSI